MTRTNSDAATLTAVTNPAETQALRAERQLISDQPTLDPRREELGGGGTPGFAPSRHRAPLSACFGHVWGVSTEGPIAGNGPGRGPGAGVGNGCRS